MNYVNHERRDIQKTRLHLFNTVFFNKIYQLPRFQQNPYIFAQNKNQSVIQKVPNAPYTEKLCDNCTFGILFSKRQFVYKNAQHMIELIKINNCRALPSNHFLDFHSCYLQIILLKVSQSEKEIKSLQKMPSLILLTFTNYICRFKYNSYSQCILFLILWSNPKLKTHYAIKTIFSSDYHNYFVDQGSIFTNSHLFISETNKGACCCAHLCGHPRNQQNVPSIWPMASMCLFTSTQFLYSKGYSLVYFRMRYGLRKKTQENLLAVSETVCFMCNKALRIRQQRAFKFLCSNAHTLPVKFRPFRIQLERKEQLPKSNSLGLVHYFPTLLCTYLDIQILQNLIQLKLTSNVFLPSLQQLSKKYLHTSQDYTSNSYTVIPRTTAPEPFFQQHTQFDTLQSHTNLKLQFSPGNAYNFDKREFTHTDFGTSHDISGCDDNQPEPDSPIDKTLGKISISLLSSSFYDKLAKVCFLLCNLIYNTVIGVSYWRHTIRPLPRLSRWFQLNTG